jgi:FkbM family methyltransferase
MALKPGVSYHSHIGQDRWVAEVYDFKSAGYFLDFGAFDGMTISNTYSLEKGLGWSGICVEPNPTYFPALCSVRSSILANFALWSESFQSVELLDAHGLSSLVEFGEDDENAMLRRQATRRTIEVCTIQPTRLLHHFGAPCFIEYLSLDVEGAEPVVLEALDFSRYKIGLLTVEHNHNVASQGRTRKRLSSLGYRHVEILNEDWWWNPRILEEFASINDVDEPGDVALRVHAEYGVRR